MAEAAGALTARSGLAGASRRTKMLPRLGASGTGASRRLNMLPRLGVSVSGASRRMNMLPRLGASGSGASRRTKMLPILGTGELARAAGAAPVCCTLKVTSANVTESPSWRFVRVTFLPSTKVPLVLPRSTICRPLRVAVSLACAEDTLPLRTTKSESSASRPRMEDSPVASFRVPRPLMT